MDAVARRNRLLRGLFWRLSRLKWFLYFLALGLLVLHQDFWNWDTAQPLAFGFLPVGLWYHGLFAVACAVLMALFVGRLWPKELEQVERESGAGEELRH